MSVRAFQSLAVAPPRLRPRLSRLPRVDEIVQAGDVGILEDARVVVHSGERVFGVDQKRVVHPRMIEVVRQRLPQLPTRRRRDPHRVPIHRSHRTAHARHSRGEVLTHDRGAKLHDLDHPGVNNAFLSQHQRRAATVYNDLERPREFPIARLYNLIDTRQTRQARAQARRRDRERLKRANGHHEHDDDDDDASGAEEEHPTR